MSTPIIDWEPPKARASFWAGSWDQFVGPGATTAELVIQLGGALLGGALCIMAYLMENQDAEPWQKVMVSALAIDMVGGVVTNATSAAKRWYHRSGQSARDHFLFVSIHALQIWLVSILSPDTMVFFGWVYGFIMLSSIAILITPLYLQRPVSMLLAVCSIPMSILLDDIVPVGMKWFVPILCLKLLVSHLVKEAPFQPETSVKTPRKV